MNLRRLDSIHRPGGKRPGNRRRGITLLEVVIAMAIFVMTLPALNALVLLGMQRAEETKILATASLMCRSKMAEITAGSIPFASSDWTALDDPNWQWKVDAGNAAGVAGMQTVQVSVKLDNGSGVNYEQTLIQMVLDPSTRGSTQDRYLLDPAAASAQSGTTNSNSSASSASGTGSAATGSTGSTGGAASGGSAGAAPNGKTAGKTSGATGATGKTSGAAATGKTSGAAATGGGGGGATGMSTGATGATGGGGGGGGGAKAATTGAGKGGGQ